MRAVYYEQNGTAKEVLHFGEVETPQPGPGEVRIKLKTSGVNPSDVKNRAGTTRKIAFPRVIPHSDGAGVIDAVGEGVATSRIGERVWTWNGQWKRPFGTAAEYITLPASQAVKLPDAISFEAGACFGIPALTAWHAVDIAGTTKGMTLLIAAVALRGRALRDPVRQGTRRDRDPTTIRRPKAKLAREAARPPIDRKTGDVGARVGADQGRRRRVIELDSRRTPRCACPACCGRGARSWPLRHRVPRCKPRPVLPRAATSRSKFLLVYHGRPRRNARAGCRHHPHAGKAHADPQSSRA